MRIVFFGAGEFGLPTLESLRGGSIDIALVVTQPDRKAGRGRHTSPTPINQKAAELRLPVTAVANVNEPEFIDRLATCKADVGVVIDFGQKVGPAARGAFRGGCINLHGSLLPLYRGAAPVQWAVIRGETNTGVTVFKLVDRMDAGPILSTRELAIDQRETAAELHNRLAALGPPAVWDALRMFENDRVPDGTPQNDTMATKAPKFTKQDGRIDFDDIAETIARRIRGLWTWPGAACRFIATNPSRDETVTIARAIAITGSPSPPTPGVLDDDLRVFAREGCIEILEIKPQSGKLMTWRDFVNGRRAKPGDQFERLPID